MEDDELAGAIAIVGMAGQFPGAVNIDEYWRNLVQGIESISFFSETDLDQANIPKTLYTNPQYVKAKGIIDKPEFFDANFFGYATSEAINLDPQQRLFLECAWQALEHAGYDSEQVDAAIGVFASSGFSSYLLASQTNIYQTNTEQLYQLMLGNDKDYLSTRVSYELNLKGPSVNIQTACSSSLVAVHMACQSLLNGECDMALAGGVSVGFPQVSGYLYVKGMILSPDGSCRAFDERASGTIEGHGLGIVVLKPLVDALNDCDTIHAVILGSAINNDGAQKVGYTSPSINQQSAVINEALSLSNITVDKISYVETHGTGTPLGDPIEIAALSQVFNQRELPKESCVLGAVKTNIGHLNTASGIAGLIKTVLALKNEIIPPTLHFNAPNPELNLENSPFKISAEPLAWQRNSLPRIAGVSSFGIGGTNAHLIVQESPKYAAKNDHSSRKSLLLFSTKSVSTLHAAAKNLIAFLEANTQYALTDIAYTSQVGRKGFDYRGMVVCSSPKDAIEKIEQLINTDSLRMPCKPVQDFIWVFPGQGSQYRNMACQLYKSEIVFRKYVDECCAIFSQYLETDLLAILFSATLDRHLNALTKTIQIQPVIFTIEYALAMTLIEWGLKPTALIGHSLGEYAAACVAGVFSLPDAIMLLCTRCQLMESLDIGAMLAVSLSEREVNEILLDGMSISAINSPKSCVVSGTMESVDKFQLLLETTGVGYKRLTTTHAFHSDMMEPMLEEFRCVTTKIQMGQPRIPIVSTVSGSWLRNDFIPDSSYWVSQLREPVLFSQAVQTAFGSKPTVFLEIGPDRALSSLIKQNFSEQSNISILSALPHALDSHEDDVFMLNTLGHLWLHGISLDYQAYHQYEQRNRVPIPTYPFERQYYSLLENQNRIVEKETPKKTMKPKAPQRSFLATEYVPATNELEHILVEFLQDLLLMNPIGIYDDFFSLGGNSLMGIQLIGKIRSTFQVEISIRELFECPTIKQLAQRIVTGIETLTEDQVATIDLSFTDATVE